MEKNNYELFDEQVNRFLRHQMTVEEEQEFRNLLANNPELKERAQVTALMIKQMEDLGKEQDQTIISEIKRMSKSEFRKVAGLKPQIKIVRFVKYAAAACVVSALAFGGYKYYDHRQTISLGDDLYTAYEQDINEAVSMRGAGNLRGMVFEDDLPACDSAACDSVSPQDVNPVDQLKQLFANVRDGKNLKQTISELESIYKQSLNEDSEYYYYDNDIAWNLAIAYLKTGDKKKAKTILGRMISENKAYPDSKALKSAKELLDQIK